jgi:hypothetical protein
MRWPFSRRRNSPEQAVAWTERRDELGAASEAEKEAAAAETVELAKAMLPESEVQEILSLSEDEADRQAARELRAMKRSDPSAYAKLLASLPESDRHRVEEIQQRYS